MVREGRTVHKFRQTMQEVREASDGALPGPGEAGGGGAWPQRTVPTRPVLCHLIFGGACTLKHICMPHVLCIHVYNTPLIGLSHF